MASYSSERPMSFLPQPFGPDKREHGALPVEMTAECDHGTGHCVQADVAVERRRPVRLRRGVWSRIARRRHGRHPADPDLCRLKQKARVGGTGWRLQSTISQAAEPVYMHYAYC